MCNEKKPTVLSLILTSEIGTDSGNVFEDRIVNIELTSDQIGKLMPDGKISGYSNLILKNYKGDCLNRKAY